MRSINSLLSLLTLFIIIKSISFQLSTAEENTGKKLHSSHPHLTFNPASEGRDNFYISTINRWNSLWGSLRKGNWAKVQRRFFREFFSFTYSQEDNRRQRQKRQHGFWLPRSSQKTDAADRTWQESVEEDVPLWKGVWVEGGERNKGEWGCQDRGLQNRTTTENPLSLGLYPTTPLRPGPARPIPPLHTPTTRPPPPPTPPVISLHFTPHQNNSRTLSFQVEETPVKKAPVAGEWSQ